MTIDYNEKDEIYLKNVEKIGNSVKNIKIVENVLIKEDHQKLVNFAKNVSKWEKQPWGVYRIISKEMPNHIVEILSKIFKTAYENFIEMYDIEIEPTSELFNVVKFEEGYAMHPHADVLSVPALHLASVYYINDDYSGGEINFLDHDLTIKPNANSLILFPGNENYWHETLKVTENTRYTSIKFFKFSNSTFSSQTPTGHSGKEYYDRF